MANQPQDREDLLREATALVERAEFIVDGEAESFVVGFRRDGSASFFFGVDPVYQFNKSIELRRAYRHGFLIKAEQGHLIRLERRRTSKVVELLRHEMSADEERVFIDGLVATIGRLHKAIGQGDCKLVGRVPGDVDVMQRITRWLDDVSLPPKIASTPRVEKLNRPAK